MIRWPSILGVFVLYSACTEEATTPTLDPQAMELAALVRQVCAADSGEYTEEACIIEYQGDVLTFATQAEDSDACFNAFIQGLRCEASEGSGADTQCYGTIDFPNRCLGAQGIARANVPDDARAAWTPYCRHESACFDGDQEECLLRRYIDSEVYRRERSNRCPDLQLAYRNCVATQPCRETTPCRSIRDEEIQACNYPQLRKSEGQPSGR